MALADKIKERMAQFKATQPAGDQQQAQRALQVKATGKAAATGGPATSGEAERAAQAESRTAAGQQALRGQIAAEGLGQEQQALTQRLEEAKAGLESQREMAATGRQAAARGAAADRAATGELAGMQRGAQTRMAEERMSANYSDALANLASDRGVAEDNLWQQFDQSSEELEFRKDAADLEQLAHVMAMRDKDYLQELNNIATMNGLQDQLQFAKSMQDMTMGEEVSQLMDQYGWQEAYNKDARTFEKELQDMGLDQAMEIAMAKTKAANTQKAIEGAGQAASIYVSEDEKQEAESGS